MIMKNKIISSLIIIALIGGINISYAKSFKDLENHEWAKKYIEEYSEKNIVNGYEDDTFRPGEPVTREQFAKIVVNVFELKIDNKDFGFKDVEKGAWYYDYVNTLANLGIIKGINNTEFGVGKSITREDICTILYRILEMKELDVDGNKKLSFEDKDKISEYAKEAIEKLYSAGIINGVTEKEMKPKDNTTRAQMVKMVYLLKEGSHPKKTKTETSEDISGEKQADKKVDNKEETIVVKKERERKVTINGKEYVLDPNEDYPHNLDGKLVTFVEGKKGVKIKEVYTADELLKYANKVLKVSDELVKIKSGDEEVVIDLDILKNEFDGRVVTFKVSKDKKGNNRVDNVNELKSINDLKIAKGNRILTWPHEYDEYDDIEVLFVIK